MPLTCFQEKLPSVQKNLQRKQTAKFSLEVSALLTLFEQVTA